MWEKQTAPLLVFTTFSAVKFATRNRDENHSEQILVLERIEIHGQYKL